MGVGRTTSESKPTWAPPANVSDAIRRGKDLNLKIKRHKTDAKTAAKANTLHDFNYTELNNDCKEFKCVLEYLEQAAADNDSSMYANKNVQFLSKVYRIGVYVVWGGFAAYSSYQQISAWSKSGPSQSGNSTETGSSPHTDSSTSDTSEYIQLIIAVAMGYIKSLNENYRKKHKADKKELENHSLTPSQTIEIVRQGYKCMKHHSRSTQPKPNSDLRPSQDDFAAPTTDVESQQISPEMLTGMYLYRYRKIPKDLRSHYLINPSYLTSKTNDNDLLDEDRSLSEVYPLDTSQASDMEDREDVDK